MTLLNDLRTHFKADGDPEGKMGPNISLLLDVLNVMALSDAAKQKMCAHIKKDGVRFWKEFEHIARQDFKGDAEKRFAELAGFLERKAPKGTNLEPVVTLEAFVPPSPRALQEA